MCLHRILGDDAERVGVGGLRLRCGLNGGGALRPGAATRNCQRTGNRAGASSRNLAGGVHWERISDSVSAPELVADAEEIEVRVAAGRSCRVVEQAVAVAHEVRDAVAHPQFAADGRPGFAVEAPKGSEQIAAPGQAEKDGLVRGIYSFIKGVIKVN